MNAHTLTPQPWAAIGLSDSRGRTYVAMHTADPRHNESQSSHFSGWCRRRRKTPLPILTAFADTRPW